MTKKREIQNLFDKLTIGVALIVVLSIGIAIASIVIKGLPYLKGALASQEVTFAVKLSLFTASVSTVICILLAVPTAYALTKTAMPCKQLMQMIIELPLSLPYLVLGLSLLLVFASDFGKILAAAGFKIIFTKSGIIAAHVIVNLPFMVRMLRTAFGAVDTRFEFIARTLGASKAKSFFTITLPLAKHTVMGAIILSWSRALGEFGATLMLVGTTRMKTETLPASIYLNMATGDTGLAMASAIILLSISAVSLLIFNRIHPKGERNRLSMQNLQ